MPRLLKKTPLKICFALLPYYAAGTEIPYQKPEKVGLIRIIARHGAP
jgi:hypothetical protein